MLWQPLITKTNDHINGKSLKTDIKWEIHKRTWQGASSLLESYLYKVLIVCATNNYTCPHVHATFLYLPHFLLKATMLYICALVKIVDDGLDFYFSLVISFYFSFLYLEQLGLGLIGHTVTSVTTWWHSYKMDHGT